MWDIDTAYKARVAITIIICITVVIALIIVAVMTAMISINDLAV